MSYTFIETSSPDDFTHRAVELLTHRINHAIADHGSCIIGLSGGSTPRPVYEALGKETIDWSKVSIFLIDERYSDVTSDDSNQKLIRDTLLKNASIPEANICMPDTSLPIEKCVKKYAEDVKTQWSEYLPDVAVLGMGDDAHIASLFPPVAEKLMDDSRLVAHTITDKFVVKDRITLTLNPIAACGSHLFLLKGADKKRVWDEMMVSHQDESRWPAKRVVETGDVTVLHV